MSYFKISFEFDDVFFKDQIWPNGDAPEKPTTKDVLDQIKKSRTFSSFVEDWNLQDSIIINVSDDENFDYVDIYTDILFGD
jgi:hypothetical protein